MRYPFGAGAMGLAVLTPLGSLGIGAGLGLPATWVFARHILRLIWIISLALRAAGFARADRRAAPNWPPADHSRAQPLSGFRAP